ncbi:MAG: TlpA family protein disulfide reductase [Proteobacteria bacterium]|nr:TlpA family protein disulfide reductase [Pseudomonadota bacterium]
MPLKLPKCRSWVLLLPATVLGAPPPAPGVGDLAPDFTSRSLVSHEKVQLSAERGRIVFLTFFASWCAPCRKEVPVLEAVQKRLGPERARVLAVNFHEDDPRDLIRWAHKVNAQMTIVEDPGAHIAAHYGVQAIPHLLIIGPDGRILKVHEGYGDGSLEDLVDDINEVLRSTAAASAASADPDPAVAPQP